METSVRQPAHEMKLPTGPTPYSDPSRREAIKAMVGLTEEDGALLKELREVIAPHVGRIVDRFYWYLLQHDYTRQFIEDPVVLKRLMGFQKEYLLAQFGGEYEEKYFESRYRIGETHARIRLDHHFYFSAYAIHREQLFPLICHAYQNDPGKALQALLAYDRIVNLDIQIAAAPYFVLRAEEAEATVRRQQAELVQSAKMAAIGEIAAGIAHEIKNPLAGMDGALGVIGESLPAGDERRAVMEEVRRQIGRLDKTVKDLLEFARPRSPQRELADLNRLIEEALALLELGPVQQSIRIDRVLDNDLPPIQVDHQQVQQVLVNVLLNAVQAMEDGGTLRIQTRVADGAVQAIIKDAGPGIPSETVDRIFDPFFTTKHRGTGLGLSICRRIMEAHHGEVAVASRPGEGTTITLSFPMNPDDRS